MSEGTLVVNLSATGLIQAGPDNVLYVGNCNMAQEAIARWGGKAQMGTVIVQIILNPVAQTEVGSPSTYLPAPTP
jgi:hypothetical protein